MDTGSRERYQSLTAQYYNRANVIILVCSLDSEHTLTSLTKWHAEAQYYIDNSDIIYAVLATKSDLPETDKEVTLEMLQNFASHLHIPVECVFEASALSGEGVEEMIDALCETVILQFSASSLTKGSRGMYYNNGNTFTINGRPDQTTSLVWLLFMVILKGTRPRTRDTKSIA